MSALENYWQSHKDIPSQTKEILNEYLLSLKLANKAEATITKYRWILERFFFKCTTPIKELISDDVLEWLNDFSTDKSERTIDLVLSCLSSFFHFCLEEDYISGGDQKSRNPYLDI